MIDFVATKMLFYNRIQAKELHSCPFPNISLFVRFFSLYFLVLNQTNFFLAKPQEKASSVKKRLTFLVSSHTCSYSYLVQSPLYCLIVKHPAHPSSSGSSRIVQGRPQKSLSKRHLRYVAHLYRSHSTLLLQDKHISQGVVLLATNSNFCINP